MEIKGALGDMWGHLAAGISSLRPTTRESSLKSMHSQRTQKREPLTYTPNASGGAMRARTRCYLHAAISALALHSLLQWRTT